jgi:flagellar basal-body rod protein FlgB
MDLPGIGLFRMISQQLHWLGQRQEVLSQNVANADTPGYQARDLQPLAFGRCAAAGRAAPGRDPCRTPPRQVSRSGGGEGEGDHAVGGLARRQRAWCSSSR